MPGEERWIRADEIGKNADLEIIKVKSEFNRWSATVRVPPDSKGVYLDVHGAPRHVIEAMGFSYLDTDEKLGKWSYSGSDGGMIVTLSIPDDRYCEGRWPVDVESASSYTLRKVIYAGAAFRKDYVAPGTVIGVTPGGELKRSTGGFIPKEAADDDEHQLAAGAAVAAAWYTVQHQVLSLDTVRIKTRDELDVGYMVAEVGEHTVGTGHRKTINSPVTEIRISSPIGKPGQTAPIRMTLTTWAGELDPLLLPPPDSAEVPFSSTVADETAHYSIGTTSAGFSTRK